MAEIGDALVDIRADIKSFAADVEKVRAILESLDDKVIKIKVQVDKKSLAAAKKQLEALNRIESLLSAQVSLLAQVSTAIDEGRQLVAQTGNLLNQNTGFHNQYLRDQFELNRAVQAENDALRSHIQLQNEINRTQVIHLQLQRLQRQEQQRLERELQRTLAATTTFHGVLGNALGRATQLSRVRFDNINQLLGSALAADSLLNVLGDIFNSALKVRRIAVQMGAALATAFTVGAQAAAGLISALATAIGLAGALAGIGLIAITVKFLLDDAEVKAAADAAGNAFRETVVAASGDLKQNLVGFFQEFDRGIRSQADAFESFFTKVNGPLKRVGEEFNKFIASDDFDRILGKIGDSTAGFLNKVADGLIDFILGTEKVFGAIGDSAKELRAALGPGIFEGISADGIVAGIERLTRALVSAGPGIKAFKENFGLAFDSAQLAMEGVLKTIGEVGDELFNALGPIAAQAATTIGQIASSFIRLSAEVFPAIQESVIEFTSVFGDNFAKSIELLAEPLSAVINAALELGTSLAPLLPIFSQILTNLDPIAVGFLNMLNSIAPLVVALGELGVQFSSAFGPTLGVIFSVLSSIASLISTVLTPVITFLANSALVLWAGGLVAVATVIGLLIGSVTVLQARFLALATSTNPALAGMRTGFALVGSAAQGASAVTIGALNGIRVALGSIAGTAGAAAGAVNAQLARLGAGGAAAAGALTAAGARIGGVFTAIGAAAGRTAGVVRTAFSLMSASALQNAAATASAAAANASAQARMAAAAAAATGATRAQAAAATAASVALRVQAVGLTAVAAASRVAAVGVRAVGTAFRFMGGPITLVILAIQAIIVGFEGIIKIGQGVADVLIGIFTLDFDRVQEGFSKVTEGAVDTVNAVVDSFTGGGDAAGEGLATGVEAGADAAAAAVKGKLGGITFEAGQAGAEAAQSFSEQLEAGLQGLDLAGKLEFLNGPARTAGQAFTDRFIAGAQERLTVANFLEGAGFSEGIVEEFRNTGFLSSQAYTAEIDRLVQETNAKMAAGVIDQRTTESILRFAASTGNQQAKTLLDNYLAGVEGGKPTVKAITGEALSPDEAKAKEQGAKAAENMIKSVKDGLEASSGTIGTSLLAAFDKALPQTAGFLAPKINNMFVLALSTAIASNGAVASQLVETLSLAFDGAFGILPGVLGPKLSNMLQVAFATSIATSAAVLSPQIVASMSLAFDGAFAILPGVLGPKLSTMLSTAFAFSIATSGAALSPQIVASMSLAFDGAFAILPGVLGPKISAMLSATFAAMSVNGLALASIIQTVFTAAFTFAFMNMPAAIAPALSAAMLAGVNLALNGFGSQIQGTINDAFISGFSGVGAAISGALAPAFAQALAEADTFGSSMQEKMSTTATNMGTALDPIKESIPQDVTDAMVAANIQAISGGVTLVNSVRQAANDIEGLGGQFYNSGYTIGSRLAAGIRAATAAEVIPAANDMAAAVAARVPESPAKKGPLSGKGDPLISGGEIVRRLVAGMQSEQPNLEATISKLLAEFNRRQGNLNFGSTNGGFSVGRSSTGISGDLTGRFNPRIGGDILQQDTNARISSGTSSNTLQIRPGTINITVPGTDDPREFINALSRELMTNCIAR